LSIKDNKKRNEALYQLLLTKLLSKEMKHSLKQILSEKESIITAINNAHAQLNNIEKKYRQYIRSIAKNLLVDTHGETYLFSDIRNFFEHYGIQPEQKEIYFIGRKKIISLVDIKKAIDNNNLSTLPLWSNIPLAQVLATVTPANGMFIFPKPGFFSS